MVSAVRHTRSVGGVVFDVGNYSLLSILSVVMLYPFVHMFFASISDGYLLMAHTGILVRPVGFSLGAYQRVWENPMIVRGFANTLFVVIVGTGVNLLMTAMGAYVLSRKNVYWQRPMMVMIVITMFFSGGLIPFYLLVMGLGLYNSLWSVIVAFAVNAYNLIIMRTYFSGIPDSLEESAKIDGANDFTILFRVILPVATPVIATMGLFYGVSRWNGWFYTMIFLKDRVKYPIALILREILVLGSLEDMMKGQNLRDKEAVAQTIKYATTVVATVPILVVYPFLQRYFVKGALLGSLKE
jgi:putative aldouronate transport system permease protein